MKNLLNLDKLRGDWDAQHRFVDINVPELQAFFLTLQQPLPVVRNGGLQVQTDNTSTLTTREAPS